MLTVMIASIRACPLGQFLFPKTRFRPFSLSPLPGRTFSSSTSPRTASLESSERSILDYMNQNNYDKWGWVIYRCTYNDDEAWARFKDTVGHQTRQSIAKSKAPELGNKLELTFIENRGTLDNAPKDQLRAHFNTWAAKAVHTENPRRPRTLYDIYGIPRYNYFVHVDEGALQSVVYPGLHSIGYVNLVKADWVPMSEQPAGGKLCDEDDYFEEEQYEPIDGCCEEDVGWMRLAVENLGAGFYDSMFCLDDMWHVFYKRPPEVVLY
ncbi:uncharacterized protein ACHE_11738A [Aspergillus chevalieri]|uniref:Uncharacterized protein n=1 Tax=Aspergillus chevalieri TaxID=182096 RepID=A0A7R7ZKH8_ASPCH|nr:uncharacterized protein ACHE_11738A [Aspergillus chevalieri]BCR84336.1 hypothetical protein ACHE_11738A [Aspergillus chevalieri]